MKSYFDEEKNTLVILDKSPTNQSYKDANYQEIPKEEHQKQKDDEEILEIHNPNEVKEILNNTQLDDVEFNINQFEKTENKTENKKSPFMNTILIGILLSAIGFGSYELYRYYNKKPIIINNKTPQNQQANAVLSASQVATVNTMVSDKWCTIHTDEYADKCFVPSKEEWANENIKNDFFAFFKQHNIVETQKLIEQYIHIRDGQEQINLKNNEQLINAFNIIKSGKTVSVREAVALIQFINNIMIADIQNSTSNPNVVATPTTMTNTSVPMTRKSSVGGNRNAPVVSHANTVPSQMPLENIVPSSVEIVQPQQQMQAQTPVVQPIVIQMPAQQQQVVPQAPQYVSQVDDEQVEYGQKKVKMGMVVNETTYEDEVSSVENEASGKQKLKSKTKSIGDSDEEVPIYKSEKKNISQGKTMIGDLFKSKKETMSEQERYEQEKFQEYLE